MPKGGALRLDAEPVSRGTPVVSPPMRSRGGEGGRRPTPVTSHYHRPVLLEETLSVLALRPGAVVVDGTVGGGGHAAAILDETAPDGIVVALDVDEEAMQAASERLREYGERVRLRRASFRELPAVLGELGLPAVDGVLLDLGVSSRQLDAPERGFRFAEESARAAPLDMRMDRRLPATAADLLREASEADLARWLADHADLPGARRLARALVQARRERPLVAVADLLDVIRRSGVGRGRRHHPATRVFQALRIAVNDELAALEEGLCAAVDALRPGGRLAVLAYHSVEDRAVKRFLRREERGCVCPPDAPACVCGRRPRLRAVVRRPLRPGEGELRANPRARSARLRAAERLAEAAS